MSQDLYYSEDTYELIGACMRVHRELGHGFLEIVYKDAIEVELFENQIKYHREKEYGITYKGSVLQHKFYADFVVANMIILEVKAAEAGLANQHIAQVLNYLKVSGCKVGLLVNFGRESLQYKRLAY